MPLPADKAAESSQPQQKQGRQSVTDLALAHNLDSPAFASALRAETEKDIMERESERRSYPPSTATSTLPAARLHICSAM